MSMALTNQERVTIYGQKQSLHKHGVHIFSLEGQAIGNSTRKRIHKEL